LTRIIGSIQSIHISRNEVRVIELDFDQKAVVAERQGARSVIAGPGAGKSTTMVELIRALIASGVSPSDIKAVTFSNEMAKALEKKLGIKGIVSTFHSLGYAICSETERKPVEPELRYRLMCKLVKKWNLDYKELDGFIEKLRRANVSPVDAQGCGEYDYGLAAAYAEYEHARAQGGWMDFTSMLCDAVKLLETNLAARSRWQPRFLIIDESQDTDSIQFRLAQLMTEKHGNITCVGDENQCIYGFRGAKPENITTDFEKWFPNGKTLYLGKNYRCHPPGTMVDVCTRQSYGRGGPSKINKIPIEYIQSGQKAITWDRRSWRFFLRGRRTEPTQYQYSGPMLEIKTETGKTVSLTPNHEILVTLDIAKAAGKYVTYLMWKDGYGYRIGHSSLVSKNPQGKNVIRLWHRIHTQKPDKIWILEISDTKVDAFLTEQRLSVKYSILQLPFVNDTGSSTRGPLTLSDALIRELFSLSSPEGALRCLADHNKFESYPLLTLSSTAKAHLANGFFKTAAANAIEQLMRVPTEDSQSGENISTISTHLYRGLVFSLSVEVEHNYIANGIVVGNSTETIVNFVRENAPADTPKELLQRMQAARKVKGAQIGLKMYWTDDAEAESALALARKDPINSVILARTNRMVGLLERLCNRYGIRYHLLGKSGFWKQNEIRKAVEGMKLYPSMPTDAAFNLTLPVLESKYAVDDRTERDNDALENLKVLRLIGKDKGLHMAKEFCVYANKMMHRRNDPKGVSISTVHQAKGGEWKNVYVIGANAKGFPHPKGDPKEEKRIYFVAISRAIDVLRISFSGTPSPYLRRYISDEILDTLREHAEEVDRLQEQTKLLGII
jgi:superfamily I DNA/RNA helicase